MWKKFLPILPVLMLTGCAGTFTRLTPYEQPRNVNNVYPVEVAFNSQQQSLRWETIKPYVLVKGEAIPMRPVPMVTNRWEGVVSVPPKENTAIYRFKFDYLYNDFGKPPQPNSAYSQEYRLKVVDQ